MKWRGVLFFRFLVTLVDESEKIRQLSDFLVGNILKGEHLLDHCVTVSSIKEVGDILVGFD